MRDANHRGKYLQLQFTVEDKGVFTTPWTATMTYGSGGNDPTTWLEQACAENIQWYPGKDADVPRADKPDFWKQSNVGRSATPASKFRRSLVLLAAVEPSWPADQQKNVTHAQWRQRLGQRIPIRDRCAEFSRQGLSTQRDPRILAQVSFCLVILADIPHVVGGEDFGRGPVGKRRRRRRLHTRSEHPRNKITSGTMEIGGIRMRASLGWSGGARG
jgi:hypothetical protein